MLALWPGDFQKEINPTEAESGFFSVSGTPLHRCRRQAASVPAMWFSSMETCVRLVLHCCHWMETGECVVPVARVPGSSLLQALRLGCLWRCKDTTVGHFPRRVALFGARPLECVAALLSCVCVPVKDAACATMGRGLTGVTHHMRWKMRQKKDIFYRRFERPSRSATWLKGPFRIKAVHVASGDGRAESLVRTKLWGASRSRGEQS